MRSYISKIKGGGLRRAALKAAQVSLIVSDTNAGELQTVASGATFSFGDETELVGQVTERYRLSEVLPRSVIEALTQSKSEGVAEDFFESAKRHFLLLDNSQAVEKAIQAASALGFVIESAIDLVETQIDKGCAELVKRLLEMREEMAFEQPVAIVSGGEFVCPVRGNGIGGRNLESALRTAILFDELSRTENYRKTKFTALFAGTDGIDGNSTAAGAIADETTIARARNLGLTPEYFLADSDSYNFFRVLNQQIEIGATGTNVRDIRILLMN